MSPRTRLAAGLALALAGCTLTDRRTDVSVLPEGPLRTTRSLAIEVRAPAGSRANVRVAGDDRGHFQVNVPISLDVSLLPEGRHSLRVTVFDGPFPAEPVERTFEIDRSQPAAGVAPPGGTVTAPGSFQATITYSEPVDPDSVVATTVFLDDRAQGLPTTVVVAADGRSAVATLGAPLERSVRASLRLGGRDLFGNLLSEATSAGGPWQASASPFLVPDGLLGGSRLAVPVAVDPGWAGSTGPVTVLLCTGDPSRLADPGPLCLSQPLASAPGTVTFDTAALPNRAYLVTVRAPGIRDAPTRAAEVFNSLLAVDVRTERVLVNGPVLLTVTGSGDIPPVLEVLAGGVVAGTIVLGAGFGSFTRSISWNADVPDGIYPLTVRAAGWNVRVAFAQSVTVDRTPPVATLSWPAEHDVQRGVAKGVTFSEPVTGALVTLVDGTVSRSLAVSFPTTTVFPPSPDRAVLAWQDATLAVDVSGLRDAAGNAAVGTLPAAAIPVWLAPAGAGPLEAGGAPLVAKEAFVADPISSEATSDLRVALIDASDQVRGGILSDLPATPISAPGAVASGLLSAAPRFAWREVSSTGVSIALANHASFFDPAVALPGLPSVTGASPPRACPSSFGALAWTEPDGVGGRIVRFAPWGTGFVPPPDGVPTTLLDAVDDCCFLRGAESYRALAWVDGATPVPQMALSASLHVPTALGQEGPWSTMVASLNADPALAASEPALFGRRLAWTEGTTIRGGRIDDAGTGFVREDPGSAPGARRPRFLDRFFLGLEPLLIFLEPGATGDVIAARRWVEGTGWVAVPPVNGGVVGEVRTLAVSAQHVTWTDAAGHVYARRINR